MIVEFFNKELHVYYCNREERRAFEPNIVLQGWTPHGVHPFTHALIESELCGGYFFVRYSPTWKGSPAHA